jgi:hypothetical protein
MLSPFIERIMLPSPIFGIGIGYDSCSMILSPLKSVTTLIVQFVLGTANFGDRKAHSEE